MLVEKSVGRFGCPSGHKREAGEKPARSRHCMWEATFHFATQAQLRFGEGRKVAMGVQKALGIHEPGDLPEVIGHTTPRGNGESGAFASLAS